MANLRQLLLSIVPHRKLKIGDVELVLDIRNKHEFRYYERAPNADALVAQRLIKPGDIVLDLGANVGYCTAWYLASGAGEVHAFEPVREIYSRLAKIDDDRLACYNFAASNQDGTTEITLSKRHNQGNSIDAQTVKAQPKIFGRKPTTETVKTARLDTLFPDKQFDFLKIDVEGAELQVLEGAAEIFATRKPRLLQIEMKKDVLPAYMAVIKKLYANCYRIEANTTQGLLRFGALDDAIAPSYSHNPANYIFCDHDVRDESEHT